MADPPKVVKWQGHTSPLLVEVTLGDGQLRKGMLLGIQRVNLNRHQYIGIGPSKMEVAVCLDTLAEIKDITDEDASFVFKDGKAQSLQHGYRPKLVLRQENDAEEVLELERLKRVKFLKPARKDSEDHAMFDHWKFSPYTGEKLAKERE
jgi:hypothetical protein